MESILDSLGGAQIQPIENLTECSTVNGEIFGYEGFVEVNVPIPGKVCLNIYMELTNMNLTFLGFVGYYRRFIKNFIRSLNQLEK